MQQAETYAAQVQEAAESGAEVVFDNLEAAVLAIKDMILAGLDQWSQCIDLPPVKCTMPINGPSGTSLGSITLTISEVCDVGSDANTFKVEVSGDIKFKLSFSGTAMSEEFQSKKVCGSWGCVALAGVMEAGGSGSCTDCTVWTDFTVRFEADYDGNMKSARLVKPSSASDVAVSIPDDAKGEIKIGGQIALVFNDALSVYAAWTRKYTISTITGNMMKFQCNGDKFTAGAKGEVGIGVGATCQTAVSFPAALSLAGTRDSLEDSDCASESFTAQGRSSNSGFSGGKTGGGGGMVA